MLNNFNITIKTIKIYNWGKTCKQNNQVHPTAFNRIQNEMKKWRLI